VHCYGMKWWTGDDEILKDNVHLHGICPTMPFTAMARDRSTRPLILQASFSPSGQTAM